ncbi:uncharacterized protein TNCV_3272641 [Trichonephila clavipes]|nr:uncharacterized protein TNCV_3272641 [Trichonephila clavipes]
MKNTQEGHVSTCQESKVWVFEDELMPTMVKNQPAMKKVMYAVFFRTGLAAEFLEQKQIKVLEHPPYSPDLAMCDFWLFINLKKNLRGRCFHSDEDIDAAINAFFLQFQEMNGFMHLICGKFVYKKCIDAEGD